MEPHVGCPTARFSLLHQLPNVPIALCTGMLCTLSWARERGFEDADIPLHVYGPPGLADYIRSA